MSKASEWADMANKADRTHPEGWFKNGVSVQAGRNVSGQAVATIDGQQFQRDEVLSLAHWILDTFGEPEASA